MKHSGTIGLCLWVVVMAMNAIACAAQRTEVVRDSVSAPAALREPGAATSLGMRTFFVADATRAYDGANGPRQIGVRVFYPAASPRGVLGRYAVPALVAAMREAGYFNVPDQALATWNELSLPVHVGAPVSRAKHWPLILFAAGYGVSAVNYTVFAQDLASRGFVVAVLDSPGHGFMLGPGGAVWSAPAPDESLAPVQALEVASDVRAVASQLLDQREFNIDPERIAAMGHSLGGAAALEACRLDSRFRACINLDGHPFGPVQQAGLGAATLVFNNKPTPRGTPLGPMGVERATMWREIADRSPQCVYVVTISETSHLSFTDFYVVVPDSLASRLGDLPGNELYEAVGEITHGFLTEAFEDPLAETVPEQVARRDYASIDVFGPCARGNRKQ